MYKVTIGDLFLGKQYKRRIGNSSIIFVEGGMLKVSVGPMLKTVVVAIVEVIILRTSVDNMTRSLICPILRMTPNNKQRTICDMRPWEGPRIPLDEFDAVQRPRVEKLEGYDLWADINSLKADITFKQLLEISPMTRKTLKKDRMPVTQKIRKAKTRVDARVQLQGGVRDVKAVEIEIMVKDKVVLNVLVDRESGLNIMPKHTLRQLGHILRVRLLSFINIVGNG